MLRSALWTHVVGLPGPCTSDVLSQCASLPPVAPIWAPRSSQHSQYRMAAALAEAEGSGGWK